MLNDSINLFLYVCMWLWRLVCVNENAQNILIHESIFLFKRERERERAKAQKQALEVEFYALMRVLSLIQVQEFIKFWVYFIWKKVINRDELAEKYICRNEHRERERGVLYYPKIQ